MAKISKRRYVLQCDNEIESSVGSLESSGKRKPTGDDYSCCQKPKKSINSHYYSCSEDEEQSSKLYAEPLIRCVWTGDFNIWYDESIYPRRVYSFNAFLSSKACQKVCVAAAEMDPMLCFEIVPRCCVWPKEFRRPTDEDIAVYLFPQSKKHEELYDLLVFDMISKDLGMRVLEQNNMELLIFTSVKLPPRCRRYQGKYYLWGVFRGKKNI